MSRHLLRAVSLAAGFCTLTLAGGLPAADAAPASQASLRAAEHARIVEHWTPERRAAAVPRDFVLDEQGRAYLKLPGGALQPYGRSVAEAGGKTPTAKPGGGGGGGGSSDTEAPAIDVDSMNPADGAKVGAAYTFSAVVTDNVALRSVTFKVRKGSGRAQSFSATVGTGDTWSVPLQGFTDGAWSWWVEAKDTANLTSVSPTVNFSVNTGGVDPGTGDTVTNAHWTADSVIKRAVGRIYFEMPSNSRWTRWAGYVCSGTVMKDGVSNRSVIITAAHCVYDDANKAFARNVLFIPNQDGTTGSGTDLNCSNDPIGCWSPSFGVVDVNWTTRTFPDNVAWDYAYYVVANDSAAYTPGIATTTSTLDAAAGAMPVNFGAAASIDTVAGKNSGDFTWALGYSYSDDPNFMYCAEDMSTAQEPDDWWLPSCGLSGGSSGGSWLQKGSGSSADGSDIGDTGEIMSVNSWGYTTGPGMAGPKLDRGVSSAECVFGNATVLSLTLEYEANGRQGAAVTCP
jgi:hypothetical protein